MQSRIWHAANCVVTAAFVVTGGSACGSGGPQPTPRPEPSQQGASSEAKPPAWIARMDADGRPKFSAADVEFLQGMIHHHAQAVLMAAWAPSHGASSAIAELCARIVVAQRDEIGFMQRWLREHQQTVPSADSAHFLMAGMDMDLMPGMLTAAQLQELDKARGKEFDRLFLQYMIMHHRGAIAMVDKLFSSPGATQDGFMFKFASDVDADQSAEIERMARILTSGSLAVPPGSP
jgi:uncharacterized protein (DUF305 family)